MKLKALINKFTTSITNDALAYAKEKSILEVNIPEPISDFITKLNKSNEELTEFDFNSFNEYLQKIENNKVKYAIIGILHNVILQKFKAYTKDIAACIKNIDARLNEGKELNFLPKNNQIKFQGLLNLYLLTIKVNLEFTSRHGKKCFPLTDTWEIINYGLPFAINAITLTNQLPKGTRCGFYFGDPLYPKNLNSSTEKMIRSRKGIKDSKSYFPYKMAFKLLKGDTGDNTFLATDGKKVLYVRGIITECNAHYSPEAIVASKIARFVSKTHFASERLLNNHLTGSKKLDSYNISIADPKIFSNINKFKQQKIFIPGSGIIDEVLNFVLETDNNFENFGLSTPNIRKASISKIDFDHCELSRHQLTKENYERNILFRHFYGKSDYVRTNQRYIDEKLRARLKLSLMSQEFINALATKADFDDGNEATQELFNRTNIALDLFLENTNLRGFLQRNPNLLKELVAESKHYISSHFDTKEQAELIQSIIEKEEVVAAKLMTLCEPQTAIKVSKNSADMKDDTLIHLIRESIEKDSINEYNNFVKDIAREIARIETSFYGQEKLKKDKIQVLRLLEACAKATKPIFLSASLQAICNLPVNKIPNFITNPNEFLNKKVDNLNLVQLGLNLVGAYNDTDTIYSLLSIHRHSISHFFNASQTSSKKFIDTYSKTTEQLRHSGLVS